MYAGLNNFVVQVKRATQNFSPVTYLDNNSEMTTFFNTERIQLSKTLTNWFEYNVDRTSTSFTDHIVYTDQLF